MNASNIVDSLLDGKWQAGVQDPVALVCAAVEAGMPEKVLAKVVKACAKLLVPLIDTENGVVDERTGHVMGYLAMGLWHKIEAKQKIRRQDLWTGHISGGTRNFAAEAMRWVGVCLGSFPKATWRWATAIEWMVKAGVSESQLLNIIRAHFAAHLAEQI